MGDNNHMLSLRFAGFQPLYAQQQKTALPKELQLSEKVLALANNPLPTYSFTKEYEVCNILILSKHNLTQIIVFCIEQLIASYSDISAKGTKSDASNKSVTSSTTVPSSSGAVGYPSPHDPVTISIHSNPPPPISADQAVAEEVAKHEALTVAMMSETGKERDVCFFFLESVNWDLHQAIEMLKSVDIKQENFEVGTDKQQACAQIDDNHVEVNQIRLITIYLNVLHKTYKLQVYIMS